jgi:hypothetical protein
MVFQNVCAAMVQNSVASAAATVEAVALLEGGPLKKPDLDIASSSQERQQYVRWSADGASLPQEGWPGPLL